MGVIDKCPACAKVVEHGELGVIPGIGDCYVCRTCQVAWKREVHQMILTRFERRRLGTAANPPIHGRTS